MTTIHIEASSGYDVTVGRSILSRIGAESKKLLNPARAVIVTGEHVAALYCRTVSDSLSSAGFNTLTFVHRSGESAKSLGVYGNLLEFLCENRISQSDALFALGGGVTGDLTGFAAATYQRGIPYIQIPTTLLAAVDSSVGGKTAVNLPQAKNQVGCFYQPMAVFCDPDVLSTLPAEDYRCGCAEVIKYGVLGNAELFARLERTDIRTDEEAVIAECIRMKRDIVMEDEFDRGRRRLLNLGHTFGHAVEKCSGYTVAHGDAVAIGLAIITRSAVKKGICGADSLERIIAVLEKYSLPTECCFSLGELYDACLSDKKFSGGRIQLVVPETIGRCRIIPVEAGGIKDWLTAGGIR